MIKVKGVYALHTCRFVPDGWLNPTLGAPRCRRFVVAGHDKDKWYAMKTLSKYVIIERNHVGMVMKERNLLARLHCPQMVNMHYAFQDARNLYIVMDVCLGGDLHYQLTHSPHKCFSEVQARFYAASIICCLEYMHGVGVLHRDVKPENLLLEERGQLKVTDLGISMELQDGICTSTSGTRSVVYSSGCCGCNCVGTRAVVLLRRAPRAAPVASHCDCAAGAPNTHCSQHPCALHPLPLADHIWLLRSLSPATATRTLRTSIV